MLWWLGVKNQGVLRDALPLKALGEGPSLPFRAYAGPSVPWFLVASLLFPPSSSHALLLCVSVCLCVCMSVSLSVPSLLVTMLPLESGPTLVQYNLALTSLPL